MPRQDDVITTRNAGFGAGDVQSLSRRLAIAAATLRFAEATIQLGRKHEHTSALSARPLRDMAERYGLIVVVSVACTVNARPMVAACGSKHHKFDMWYALVDRIFASRQFARRMGSMPPLSRRRSGIAPSKTPRWGMAQSCVHGQPWPPWIMVWQRPSSWGGPADGSHHAPCAPGSTRTVRTTPFTVADGMLVASTKRAAVPTVCAGSGR
jgi:hypothetical protein